LIPPRHAHRTAGFQESIIREMTRLCARAGGINLSQGLPDMPAPKELKEAACRAIREDHNQYSFTYGLPELREAVSKKLRERNGMDFSPEEEITITCGVSEGVMASCLALLNPGDEVVVFEPYYENYLPAIRMAGAVPKFVALEFPDWHFDGAKLEAAFGGRTRAIIVNNPMNPAGKVFDRNELCRIADLCVEHDAVIITDEIYEDIVYEGEHLSIGAFGEVADRVVSVMGISKTYGVTGWRVGYVAANGDLMTAIRKVHDYMTVCAPTPFQWAALTALSLPQRFYREIREDYRIRRDLLCGGLREIGFGLESPRGAYYVLTDFAGIRNDLDDRAFAEWLVADGGVATVPGGSFYALSHRGRSLIRFCFAMRESTLAEALDRIRSRIAERP